MHKNNIDTERILCLQTPYFSSGARTQNSRGVQELEHAPDFSPRVLDIKDTKEREEDSENEREILELISKNKYITYSELSKGLRISEKSVHVNIEKLKQKGLLKRIGSDRGGYWKIVEGGKNEKN